MTRTNKQIYTDFRVTHTTLEDKIAFEQALAIALKKQGYAGRVEFIREKIRELIKG